MDSPSPNGCAWSGQAEALPQSAAGSARAGIPLSEGKVRTQLAARLNGLIKERQLTQTAAAVIFGIPQPHVSELRHFKLTRFSAERLLHFITLLDRDVEIVIRPKDEASATGTVSVQGA